MTAPLRRLIPAAALVLVVPSLARGQATGKKILGVDDYTRWRNIEGAQISGDGRWTAGVLRLTNLPQNDSRPELRLRNLDTDQEVVIAHASNPAFSNDSRWIVYQVDSMPARAASRSGRGGAGPDSAGALPPAQQPGPPPAVAGAGGRSGATPQQPLRRYELRNLQTGATQAWKDIASATFSNASTHLILRRRGAAGGGGGGRGGPDGPGGGQGGGDAGAGASAPRGADVILVDLATGRSQTLGTVGDIAFSRQGTLLAYTVDAAVDDANGAFVVDLGSTRTYTLDNDAQRYSRLAWTADGQGLAVLKGKAVPRMRERANVLLAWADIRKAFDDPRAAVAVLDPSNAAGWQEDWVLSERAPLSWSGDRARVFFGAKAQVPQADTGRKPGTDSIADVDVWRTTDTRIQSAQMIRAPQEENFTYRQAFDVTAGRYIHLADTTMRQLDVSFDGKWAVGNDQRAYFSDWKPAQADLYRVNTATGERTLFLKGHVIDRGGVVGISPDGRTFLYWKDGKYQAYDLDAGTSRILGGSAAPSFINTRDDYTGPRPHFPVVAWTPDGSAAVVEHLYDTWLLPVDGSQARNLTLGAGARTETGYHWVRTEPVDDADPLAERRRREVDVAKPMLFATFGEYTKKAGFSRLEAGKLTELVYDDAAYGTPTRAAKTDRYLFTRQTFAEFPDLRVSGPAFSDARRITDANPQQAEYRWVAKRVLFDYKDRDGHKLQGFLSLPEGWAPGKKLPMLVSFYEKNSQNLNRYTPPTYITGMGALPVEAVSRGYITMFADVYYHTGSSHSDQLNAVEAATRKVIELGYADPKFIGVHGHSYGGEGAAFIGTRSRLFAAVGMGAGVTDLYTDFSQSWGWSYQVSGGSGENGNEYYMYGQGRWGVSPWEKPDLFRFESAITHAPEVTQPILIMHGTADPTVSFNEGMKFYNALRYNGKEAYMLAYPGEGHGLRGLANRKDLTTRYFEYFDHFLKGAPAPRWMTEGVPFLSKKLPAAIVP
ncbi:MAG: prolyl oligopeptidase family serine peptidase [Gemmatimonadaceae bacterium]|nr:prolyl oligopeptidase family serine peptidase [Gemmatimonadaceae bacterium]